MSFEIESPDEIQGEGGNFVDKPGTYHLLVMEVKEGLSAGKNPKTIDGFSVEFDVLAGTEADQVGKKLNLTFWKPNLQDTERQQLMTKRQNAAFAIATNLFNPTDLGQRKEVELEKACGQQVIATIERSKKRGHNGELVETEFMRLTYARIFHIDDPEAANFPRSAAALEQIESSDRRTPEFFAFKKRNEAAAPQQPVPRQAVASSTNGDFDDL